MATQVSVFSVLTIQVLVFVTMAGADLHIDAQPSTIVLGTTSSLNINCSFSLVDHPEFAMFASLILSKTNTSGQTIEDLAAITQFSPDSVNVLTTEKVSATGVHSQTGESYLQVTWEYPTATQAGVYQCVAHGLDILGQTVEVVNASEVTSAQAGLDDIFEKLKQMDKHIQALEHNNSQMVSYIAELEHTDASLRQIQLMNLIGTYKTRDYYVSRESFTNINKSIAACKLAGGHLVEVDDKDEFLAIQGFLDLTIGHQYYIIAGTDEETEGNWVFQSTNKPVPYLDWAPGQPADGNRTNCLQFEYSGGAWKMDDWHCQAPSTASKNHFMCEVKIV